MRALYDIVYNGNDYARAAEFLEPDYREHNLVVADGIEAAVEHQQQLGGYPNRILREIVDGDLHCIHVQYFYEPYDYATIDIWRVNEAGRAVEHWDSLAAMVGPEASRMIDGPTTGGARLSSTERAARVAALRRYFDVVVRRKDSAVLDTMLAPGFVEHNIGLGWFPGIRDLLDSPVTHSTVRVIGANGDMAFSWSDYRDGDKIKHVAEIFRFDAQGLIADHWDAANWQPRGVGTPRARPIPTE